MNKKQKLELLDNYTQIFKILLRCKASMFTYKNTNFSHSKLSIVELQNDEFLFMLNELSKRAEAVLESLEQLIVQEKMYDDSFLLFKQQLLGTLNDKNLHNVTIYYLNDIPVQNRILELQEKFIQNHLSKSN